MEKQKKTVLENKQKIDAIRSELQDILRIKETIISEKEKIILEKNEIIAAKEAEIKRLEHQLHQALQARFASRSEKQAHTAELAVQFDEASTPQNTVEIQESDESIHSPAAVPKKKTGRKPLPANLPRIEIVHDISESEKICECGSALCCIDAEKSEQLEYIPAMVRVIVNKRLKYACKNCTSTIKTAVMPQQIIPKSISTPSLLSHIAVSKFDDHLPLYRQEEILQRYQIDIARNTLSHWMIRLGDALLPLIKLLAHEITDYDIAFSDETPLQVLKHPEKTAKQKSYMWVFSGGAAEKQVVFYHYASSRASSVPIHFFEDFTGYLHVDGYSGYLPLLMGKKIKLVTCLAHIRRKFFAITQSTKTEGLAHQAMQWITQLYTIEKDLRENTADFDKVKAVRQEKSKPILDAMHIFLLQNVNKVPKKMPIGEAIQYALNQWPHLQHYLEDGRLAIDNNLSERAIKPFVIGRKNWLFAGNVRGAIAGAHIFTLIETAKLHKKNPYDYLCHVLTCLPTADTLEKLEALLPWHCLLAD